MAFIEHYYGAWFVGLIICGTITSFDIRLALRLLNEEEIKLPDFVTSLLLVPQMLIFFVLSIVFAVLLFLASAPAFIEFILKALYR